MATIAPNTPSSPIPQGGGVNNKLPESRRRSGTFTNLQSYLRANRDTTGQMAESVASDIEERGRQAFQDIRDEGQRVETAAKAVGPQLGAGEEAETRIKESITQTREPFTAIAAPQAQAEDTDTTPGGQTQLQPQAQNARDILEGLRGAGQQLSEVRFDAGDAAARGQRAERSAEGLRTTQGLQTATREAFQRPNYTRGENRLDTLLLQATPESRQRFAQTQEELLGTTAEVSQQAQQQALGAIESRQQELANQLQFAEGEIANQLAAEYRALENEKDELKTNLQARRAGLVQYLQDIAPTALVQASDRFKNRYGLDTIDQIDAFLAGAGQTPIGDLVEAGTSGAIDRVNNLRTEAGNVSSELLNPAEQARLNALYQLQTGDYDNMRYLDANQLNPDDLLFDTDQQTLTRDVQNAVKLAQEQFNRESRQIANDILTLNSGDRGRTIDEAIRMNTDNQLDYVTDGNRTIKINNAIQSELPKINNLMQKYGLGTFAQTPEELARTFGYQGRNINELTDFNSRVNRNMNYQERVNAAREIQQYNNALRGALQFLQSAAGDTGTSPDLYIPPAPVDDPYAGLDPRIRTRILV